MVDVFPRAAPAQLIQSFREKTNIRIRTKRAVFNNAIAAFLRTE